MTTVDINCDMGEGLPNDAELMPLISSANIACGFHAGDETIMHDTVALALAHGVAIGAHPGFDDKANFGRTEINLSLPEIYQLVQVQVTCLQQVCDKQQARLVHVKPHGALYNMAAKNRDMAAVIARSVFDIDPRLLLLGLSNSYLVSEAAALGLKTASEVFADRTYGDDGRLTPRTHANALLHDATASISQVIEMIQTGTVTSVNGNKVPIVAESICIHGDGIMAVEFAKTIYAQLQQLHIEIKPA